MPSKRRVQSSTAASPRARTSARIAATLASIALVGLGRVGEQRRERGVEARVAGLQAADRDAHCASPFTDRGQGVDDGADRLAVELQRRLVDDQPGRDRHDLLDLGQRVRLQRVARGDEVDDRVGEAGERRQLHRAVELDQVDVHALVGEVIAGDARELGGDADARALARRRRVVEAERRGDAHPAARDAEVERPIEAFAAVLDQGVEADDAEVGAAVLDVGRHVAGADQDDAQVGARGGDDQAPARLRALGELDADRGEQRQRLVEDPALGQARA